MDVDLLQEKDPWKGAVARADGEGVAVPTDASEDDVAVDFAAIHSVFAAPDPVWTNPEMCTSLAEVMRHFMPGIANGIVEQCTIIINKNQGTVMAAVGQRRDSFSAYRTSNDTRVQRLEAQLADMQAAIESLRGGASGEIEGKLGTDTPWPHEPQQ